MRALGYGWTGKPGWRLPTGIWCFPSRYRLVSATLEPVIRRVTAGAGETFFGRRFIQGRVSAQAHGGNSSCEMAGGRVGVPEEPGSVGQDQAAVPD